MRTTLNILYGIPGLLISAKKIQKKELFRKIEPYLVFLNIHQLERQGADIQTKIEEIEQLNQSMRDHDKMKDDAKSND